MEKNYWFLQDPTLKAAYEEADAEEKAYMEMAGLVKAGLSTISGKIAEDWQLTKYLQFNKAAHVNRE